MQERYTKIMQDWFLLEPALFQVLCIHELSANEQMSCPVRSGRKMLEYNPNIVREMTDAALEEALRAEAVRILLKHPYERRPDGCSQRAAGLASNLVIGDNYTHARLRMIKPQDMDLKRGMSYEWYAREIENGSDGENQSDNDSGNGKSNSELSQQYSDLAELWEDDELTVQAINGVISSVKDWGSLAGNLAEILQTSLKAKINWKNVFSGFRANILSSKKKLTRMKPNRRTGFQNMGSVRQFDTKLLIAIDVSGSVTTQSLRYFYGVVNSAFRYGFESVDVIQFDCGVRSVHTLKKVIREQMIIGRGGTSFQEPINYAHEHAYDGLLILTDGYAPQPVIPNGFKTHLLWVCENENCYKNHKKWMEESGRVCTMQI